MTDYVYIDNKGRYARLHDDPDATGVKRVASLDYASVISPAQKDRLNGDLRRLLAREFTALPATEQRTVRLETGTPYPKPGEYVDVDPADLAHPEVDWILQRHEKDCNELRQRMEKLRRALSNLANIWSNDHD